MPPSLEAFLFYLYLAVPNLQAELKYHIEIIQFFQEPLTFTFLLTLIKFRQVFISLLTKISICFISSPANCFPFEVNRQVNPLLSVCGCIFHHPCEVLCRAKEQLRQLFSQFGNVIHIEYIQEAISLILKWKMKSKQKKLASL